MVTTGGAGVGAYICARDVDGNLIGERFPPVRIFADFIVSTHVEISHASVNTEISDVNG